MKRLPDQSTVAGDWGDLLLPDWCRNEITAVRGRIKHRAWGIAQVVLIAHAPHSGPVRVLCVVRSDDTSKWVISSEIGTRAGLKELLQVAAEITGQSSFLYSNARGVKS